MFFGKPDRHGSGYRNALFADNFAVLSYCCRKACCGRRFARCGHDEKVYGDNLQRFDSARCACGGIVENRTRNNGNLACMAHRLDDCNRAVAHFLRHGRLEKYVKKSEKAFLSKRKTTKRNLKCRRNKSFRKQPNTHETCSVQSRKNAARSADIVRAAFEYSLKIGEYAGRDQISVQPPTVTKPSSFLPFLQSGHSSLR